MYKIVEATKDNIQDICKIYNSNSVFLIHHLGVQEVNEVFIEEELEEMKRLHFTTCVIQKQDTKEIIGVMDYKVDETVYLSLIMINSEYQKSGIGTKVYLQFEETMRLQERREIRIDVIEDTTNGLFVFWKNLGFNETEKIQLQWGDKRLNADVMIKIL